MQITTQINDVEFSNYPPVLNISGVTETVRVKVFVGTSLVLDVTLAGYNSTAAIIGFGDLITRYMANIEATHAKVKVELYSNSTLQVSKEWQSLYQRDETIQPAATWLQNNFLTISKIKGVLPYSETIRFFNDEDLEATSQSAKASIKAYTKDSEGNVTETVSYSSLTGEVVQSDASHDYMIYSFVVDMEAVATSAGVNVEELAAVAVEYNSRRLFYYRTDAPDIAMQYVSSFGYEEIIGIPGTTEKKISDNRQTALVGGRLIAYDNLQSFDYEFESAWISQAEIKRAVECMRSRSVSLIDGTTITISKIDTEISDEKGKAQRVKFTYRYADGTQPIAGGVHDDNIFSQQYDINFD